MTRLEDFLRSDCEDIWAACGMGWGGEKWCGAFDRLADVGAAWEGDLEEWERFYETLYYGPLRVVCVFDWDGDVEWGLAEGAYGSRWVVRCCRGEVCGVRIPRDWRDRVEEWEVARDAGLLGAAVRMSGGWW
jgi:hypothetical protein